MIDVKKTLMESLKDGGRCRLVLYHPGRQTERDLNFCLEPNESLDPDIVCQIFDQIRGYEVQEAYVNDRRVWFGNRAAKIICIDHDRVKSSF